MSAATAKQRHRDEKTGRVFYVSNVDPACDGCSHDKCGRRHVGYMTWEEAVEAIRIRHGRRGQASEVSQTWKSLMQMLEALRAPVILLEQDREPASLVAWAERNLSVQERRTLLWLAGWDHDSTESLCNLYRTAARIGARGRGAR